MNPIIIIKSNEIKKIIKKNFFKFKKKKKIPRNTLSFTLHMHKLIQFGEGNFFGTFARQNKTFLLEPQTAKRSPANKKKKKKKKTGIFLKKNDEE